MSSDDGVVTTARVIRSTRITNVAMGILLVLIVVMALLPQWGSTATQVKMVELLVLIALAQTWNLLAGFAGVVSVGQQIFVGMGAYGMIEFVNNRGANIWLSILLAGICAAVVSIPVGLVAFQLRGSYFAIGTWVLAEAAANIIVLFDRFGGGSGASIKVAGVEPADRIKYTYLVALAIAVGAVVMSVVVLRSRIGLRMQAIRDNEAGARGLGASVYRTRFTVWVLAAFVTGLAGAAFYLSQLRVQPTSSFSVVQWTAPILFIVVIGGIGTLEGPIIGAVVYWWFKDQFIDQANWYSISVGVVAVVVGLALQKGIWGYLSRYTGDLFPTARRLHSPME